MMKYPFLGYVKMLRNISTRYFHCDYLMSL
jgi:hypothetical protein